MRVAVVSTESPALEPTGEIELIGVRLGGSGASDGERLAELIEVAEAELAGVEVDGVAIEAGGAAALASALGAAKLQLPAVLADADLPTECADFRLAALIATPVAPARALSELRRLIASGGDGTQPYTDLP